MELMPQGYDDRGENPQDCSLCPECEGLGCHECGYTGTDYWTANDEEVSSASSDVCGKRLTSCKLRFGSTAELPYGSFPGIGTFVA